MEYSKSPFFDEAQALSISCESEQEVQVITTNASVIPEVQLLHLKMADNFTEEYPGETVYEIQASMHPRRVKMHETVNELVPLLYVIVFARYCLDRSQGKLDSVGRSFAFAV